MTLLALEELQALVDQSQQPCVSIYMPTIKAGDQIQQNPIRFKNLIKDAEQKLLKFEDRLGDTSKFLQPALALDKEEFWQKQETGLAIFMADKFFRYYRVPLEFQELVIVGDRFHLKPLLSLFTKESNFYILALSQKQIRFFEATRYRITEVEVEGMPTNLEDALLYDETAKTGQNRITTSKGGTNNPYPQAGNFHGQGSPDRDQHQKDILQFFYLIDHALQKVLQNKRCPLILDCIDYLVPIYQEANTYPHLMEENISTENVQIVKAEELHAKALPLIEPLFEKDEKSALEYYNEMTSTGKTSTDPKEAISAAFYGRVEQLVVPIGVQKWGKFDAQENQVYFHEEAEPGDEDLLNTAAIQTLLKGGKVYALEPDRVPESAPVAAVFRY